jgi:O-antigen/teichoic acid export membrane protein
VKNLSLITVVSILCKLLGLINLLLIFKYISNEGFALYSAILGMSTILIPFVSMTFDSYLPLLRKYTVNKIINGYLYFSLSASVIIFLCFTIASNNNYYSLAVVFTLCTVFQNTLFNYFLVNEKINLQIFVILLFNLFTEVVKFFFIIYRPFENNNLLNGSLIASILVIVISLIFLNKKINIKLFDIITKKRVANHIKYKVSSIFLQNLCLQLIPLYIYNFRDTIESSRTYMALSISTVLFQVVGKKFSDSFNFQIKCNEKTERVKFIKKYFLFIILISVFFHTFVTFILIFGNVYLPENWNNLLYYYLPFMVYSILQIVTYPITQSLSVINKSNYFLKDSIIRILIILGIIFVSYMFELKAINIIWMYALLMSIFFLLLTSRNYKWLK